MNNIIIHSYDVSNANILIATIHAFPREVQCNLSTCKFIIVAMERDIHMHIHI